MNYINTILFFVVLFPIYYLLGTPFTDVFHIQKNRFSATIVFGFIVTYFLGFLIGLPCQYLTTKWIYFALIFSVLILIIFFFLLFLYRKRIINKLYSLNENPLKYISSHLKKYWFLYLIVIISTLLSVMNMQPYLKNNYTDDHYIVQVLHMAHSKSLLGINNDGYLFTGSRQSIIAANGYRSINTYELMYSYFATVFHISIVFFCRFTMVMHNYFICYSAMILITSIFTNENHSQYGLMFIAFLLIPQGYAAKSHLALHIRMFENWRFQTGMYMGGSITRIFSVPIFMYILYLVIHVLENKKAKRLKFILITLFTLLIISCVLISFQTTGISYVGLILPIFVLALILLRFSKIKNRKTRFVAFMFTIALYFLLMYFSDQILRTLSHVTFIKKYINITTLANDYKKYIPYYKDSFTLDFFAKWAFVPLIMVFLLSKKQIEKIIVICSLILYLTFKLQWARFYLAFIGYLFFGTARIQTAVLTYLVVFFGIACVELIRFSQEHSVIRFETWLVPVYSFLIFGLVLTTIQIKQPEIITKVEEGDGMVKEGYSFAPITENDQLLPDLFCKIGDYFNQLPGDYYSVAFETNIHYRGYVYSGESILLSSRKVIRLNMSNTYKSFYTDGYANYLWNVIGFLEGRIPYKQADPYLRESKVNYLFTTNKDIKEILIAKGYKVAFCGNKKDFWLIKNKYVKE